MADEEAGGQPNESQGGTLAPAASGAKAAIIYLPGLGSDHTADRALGIARRIERALDRCAKSPRATFSTTMREVDIGDGRTVSVSTIGRSDEPNAEAKPGIDIYHLNYRRVLRSRFEQSSLPARLYYLLIATIWAVWKVVRSPFRLFKHGLSAKDRLQVAYAVFVLACLFVYLGVLVVAAISSIRTLTDARVESAGAGALNTGSSIEWPGVPGWLASIWERVPGRDLIGTIRDGVVDIVAWVWALITALGTWWWELFDGELGQSIIVLSVMASLLLPRLAVLRERMTDAAIDFLTVINYMNVGARRNVVLGHLRDLVEFIMAEDARDVEKREIHLVTYSFGTIVAFDALVPLANEPAPRLSSVTTFTTIATPVELLRTYWPNYFDSRVGKAKLPGLWYNVFGPLDVLSSQFGTTTDDPLRGYPGPQTRGLGIYGPKLVQAGPGQWVRSQVGKTGQWVQSLAGETAGALRRMRAGEDDLAGAAGAAGTDGAAGVANDGNAPVQDDGGTSREGARTTPFVPDDEVPFPFAERNRSLTVFEILSLTGFRAHTSYWEERDEAEYSAFDEIIPIIFRDSVSGVLD